MANFSCRCGCVFKVLGDYDTEYSLTTKGDYEIMLVELMTNPVTDTVYDILERCETNIYKCPRCGRYAIDIGHYIGNHLFEVQYHRENMITFFSESTRTNIPQRGEYALYHCLCGNIFPIGGYSEEHQYYFMHNMTFDLVVEKNSVIMDENGFEHRTITSDQLRGLMESFNLVYACPICGRLGMDMGGDIRVYKYEGRTAQREYLGWDDPCCEGNPHKYVFVDAPPPDARLLALQAEYRRIMGEEEA